MGFIIGLLTLLMVLDCLVLVLLILIQLPKKEAGAGLAFGGAATDALFGAGSGTVLTKITKYAAGTFFFMAVFLGLLQSRHYSGATSNFQKMLNQPGRPPAGAAVPSAPVQPSTALPTNSLGLLTPTNSLSSAPAVESTNAPANPANPGTPPADSAAPPPK